MLQWFARRLKEAREDEKGFTLIELLVVVIIIGILAAIAIPIFLNQRGEAQDNAAKANLNNAATAQASHFAAKNTFSKTEADLLPYGFPTNEEPAVSITKGDKTSFCMTATSENSGAYYVSNTNTSASKTQC